MLNSRPKVLGCVGCEMADKEIKELQHDLEMYRGIVRSVEAVLTEYGVPDYEAVPASEQLANTLPLPARVQLVCELANLPKLDGD